MKKAVFAALLAVIMIFALVSGDNAGKLLSSGTKAASAGREGKPREIPETAIFTELMHASLGSGEDEIGYEPGNESEDIGPDDFFVEGDTVAVLDSVNKKIKFFRGGSYERSIDISYMGYPYALVKLGSHIYVQDYCLDNICKIDSETGELVEKLSLPAGLNSGLAHKLFTDGYSVYLRANGYKTFDLLNPGSSSFDAIDICSQEKKLVWSTPYSEKTGTFENVSVQFQSYDNEGNAYFLVYDHVHNTSVILGEVTVQRYSVNGEMTGVARLPIEDHLYHSGRKVVIQGNGQVYYMACFEDGLRVYEVELGRTYESEMDELYERAKSLEKTSIHH